MRLAIYIAVTEDGVYIPPYIFILVFSFLFLSPLDSMEMLVNRLGLYLDQRPSELTRDLGGIRANTLARVSEALFNPSTGAVVWHSLPISRGARGRNSQVCLASSLPL